MSDQVPDLDADLRVRALHRLLAAQQEVSSALSDMPPSADLVQEVLRIVCETLGWSFGAAWRRDPDGATLSCAAVCNQAGSTAIADFAEASFEQHFAKGRGLPGYVWAGGTPVWLRDLRWDPRMGSVARAQGAGLRAAVAIPLRSSTGRLEGVLEFFSDEVRHPDDQVMSWLTTTGSQLVQYFARWRAHETLTAHDRALAAAVNGIVIADATRRGFPITYVNPGFERLTGYALADVQGRPCSLLQGQATDADAVATIVEALQAGRAARVTLRNYRKDGSEFWNELHLSPVRDDTGRLVQYIGVQNDVTEQRRAQEHADFLAFHDPLTGLANRALLQKVLDRAAARARRQDLDVALLFLDIDSFKQLNDRLGHIACDEVLRTVSDRLRATTRPADLVVRQGGDEFLVVMADLGPDAAAHALAMAERLAAAVLAPIVVGDEALTVRLSIGVSLLGHDARDADALLRHADAAMYRAKRTGRGVKLYQPTGSAPAGPAARPAAPDDGEAVRRAELDRLIAEEAIRTAYQPIVELDSGDTVAYEALARGPEGSPLARPDELFATATAADRLSELDWVCRDAAVRGVGQGLAAGQKLFINVEPLALGTLPPPALIERWKHVDETLDIVVEITERALTARPAELLQAVAEIRRRGWGIALDDVGADVRSLALMPLLHPDIIKLDLRLIQQQPTTEIAEIVNAVNAESERTGAVILAEGIETEAHVATARALGATHGQGWFFGRPGAVPADADGPRRPLRFTAPAPVVVNATPYDTVRPQRTIRRADKRLLLSITKNLEQQAAALGECGVIVSAFQSAERFTELTHRRYTLLAADAAFVAALGVGMPPEPAPGVRGAAIGPGDPLQGEWSVVVLGPHFAAALVAIDLGDDGPDMEREFDFALTYDRELVIAATNALMQRVAPQDATPA